MTARRIITAIGLIAAAFYLASWLAGDRAYLRQLTLTTVMRGMTGEAVPTLKARGSPPVVVVFRGDEDYRDTTLSEISKIAIIDNAGISPHGLIATVAEEGQKLTASLEIRRGAETLFSTTKSARIGTWTSLMPPLVAIILAICIRHVMVSLGLAIWLGGILATNGGPLTSAWYAARHYLWQSFIGEFSLLILGFVLVLVGMVNVINRGGGMAGLMNQITRIARSARTACIAAACMGTAIFFDDYTNTIVVGTTIRSFTDRMRVSREKLAYIVDSTSAPIAGLAVISTWIGFEVAQLHGVAGSLGIADSGYALFLKALPFRFYCIFTIVFVFMVCILRRDFGPMLAAERRTFTTGQLHEPDVEHLVDPMVRSTDPKAGIPERWYNAAVPVAVVVAVILAGIIIRGSQLLTKGGETFSFTPTGLRACFITIGGDGTTLFIIMLIAACAGFIAASLMMLIQRILKPREIVVASASSLRILPAALILIFAWAIRQVCDDLGTALFLTSLVKDLFNPLALPLVVFVLSAAVSFSTGTSFGTMGLMLPTIAPLAFTLGDPALFVMTLGSVLDGSIFGDHCSPISDTTVLSAVSSSCDLVDHVETQMPYAVLCMLVAGGCGYLPAAWGASPLFLYAIGIAMLLAVLIVVGRNPEKVGAPPKTLY